MTVIIRTESGSWYELDDTNKRVRRLLGATLPTPRMAADGEWRPFLERTEATEGERWLILWGVEGSVGKTTVTSRVTQVTKEPPQ